MLQALAACCYFLQRTTEIFDTSGLVLTQEQADEASKCLADHLVVYAWLASYDYERRVMRFKLRCKSHYLWHVSWEIGQYKLNQNLFHTFHEESWLGKIKAIATKCHGRTCSQRIFQRLFLCFAMFLHEHGRKENDMD